MSERGFILPDAIIALITLGAVALSTLTLIQNARSSSRLAELHLEALLQVRACLQGASSTTITITGVDIQTRAEVTFDPINTDVAGRQFLWKITRCEAAFEYRSKTHARAIARRQLATA